MFYPYVKNNYFIFAEQEAMQILMSDAFIDTKLWALNDTEFQETGGLDQVSSIILEVRELEITSIISMTKRQETVNMIKFAGMLGVLAIPNHWIVLDLVCT